MNHSLTHLPRPAARRLALRVTAPAERALRQGHPWVFASAISEQSHDGAPGDLAVIFDHKRRFLAIGLYDPTSPIRVRVLQHHQPTPINASWFQTKLVAAAAIRAPLQTQATTGYRLVHGENDGWPGLVVDRYAETLVIKLYTLAWIPHLTELCVALLQVQPAACLLLRLSRSLVQQPAHLHQLSNGLTLMGEPPDGPVLFKENGLTFECDPVHGQKTGFFLDQRDNRARVEALSQDKTVLNVFAYTGGFAVYAARGGARHLVNVDLSAPALAAATRNLAHNRHLPSVAAASHEAIAQDAFAALAQLHAAQRRFDVVILDPPMFAQNQAQRASALAAYQRLTHLGLGVLRAGGTLVQASCSSRITAAEFFDAVTRAARIAGRPFTELARTEHPLDHPIGFAEGAYLKCVFAEVG